MSDQEYNSRYEDKWLAVCIIGVVLCLSSCTAISSFAPPQSYWMRCEDKPK